MAARDKKEKYHKILMKKLDTPVEILCEKVPLQFRNIMKYVRDLQFDDEPDYAFIRSELEAVLLQNGLENDGKFDW